MTLYVVMNVFFFSFYQLNNPIYSWFFYVPDLCSKQLHAQCQQQTMERGVKYNKDTGTTSCRVSSLIKLYCRLESCNFIGKGALTCRHSGVFVVNFEHISHLFQVFLLLALNSSVFAGLLRKRVQKLPIKSTTAICNVEVAVRWYSTK